MQNVGAHEFANMDSDGCAEHSCALLGANVRANAGAVVQWNVLSVRGQRMRCNARGMFLRRRRVRHEVVPLQARLRVQRCELRHVHDKTHCSTYSGAERSAHHYADNSADSGAKRDPNHMGRFWCVVLFSIFSH